MNHTSLLADVGGTNVRFALADTHADQPLRLMTLREFGVAAYPSFVDAARYYLQALGVAPTQVDSAVFAVAGRIGSLAARTKSKPLGCRASARRACSSSLRMAASFPTSTLSVGAS